MNQNSSTNHRIKRVLIANRGEIALRIRNAAHALGIETVQVSSSADSKAFFARDSKEVRLLPGNFPKDTYLDVEALLKAARESGCDAVHPGYGFLSENADFAARVIAAGMKFIGPSPDSIQALGSKTNARKSVTARGVPVTPGSGDARTDEELLAASRTVPFPLIVKAVGGGGGRGMRVVRSEVELREALPLARAEALKNFGNEAVYFEHFIESPRHVEVQVFGDTQGKVVHLGTRDCSAQRRHQKLVEEAPAPNLSPSIREKIHRAAVAAAESVGYYNAGTAEFLVKGENFYFLEMNTRIQVEHPVTEIITGIDLVQLQFRIAAGEPLPFTQEEIKFTGHAIEFRINGEDSRNGFRPVTGPIESVIRVEEPYVREDFGFAAGDTLTPFYDSMLSKVIVKGASRDEAIYRAFDVLRRYEVRGIETTLPFHRWLLCCREFQRGGIDIGFVEREFNPESLDKAEAIAEALSPMQHGKSKALPTELYSVLGEGGRITQLRILHEPEGTYLIMPVGAAGMPLSERTWRRSIDKDRGIEAAIEGLKV